MSIGPSGIESQEHQHPRRSVRSVSIGPSGIESGERRSDAGTTGPCQSDLRVLKVFRNAHGDPPGAVVSIGPSGIERACGCYISQKVQAGVNRTFGY